MSKVTVVLNPVGSKLVVVSNPGCSPRVVKNPMSSPTMIDPSAVMFSDVTNYQYMPYRLVNIYGEPASYARRPESLPIPTDRPPNELIRLGSDPLSPYTPTLEKALDPNLSVAPGPFFPAEPKTVLKGAATSTDSPFKEIPYAADSIKSETTTVNSGRMLIVAAGLLAVGALVIWAIRRRRA